MHWRKKRLRLRKWIKPRFQLKLIANFLALSLAAIAIQSLLFSIQVAHLTERLPYLEGDPGPLLQGILSDTLLVTLAVLVPVSLLVGALITSKIAGPIYRFERYLEEVAGGTQIGPCKIRKGDELQELCGAINRATEQIRLRPRGAGDVRRGTAEPGPAPAAERGPDPRSAEI